MKEKQITEKNRMARQSRIVKNEVFYLNKKYGMEEKHVNHNLSRYLYKMHKIQ